MPVDTLETPVKAVPNPNTTTGISVKDYIPPQVPEPPKEPLKVKAGDKFRAEFEKLSKTEAEQKPKDIAATSTSPKEQVLITQPSKPEGDKSDVQQASKPSSPLDVVTADKKPEVKPEESDILEGFDEKNPDWKRAREVMKTQSKEKKVLEATIAELKKTPKSDPEEIARLTKEREELKQSLSEREDLIKTVDVRLSDEYRSIAKKRDDTVQKIASRAKAYGADADILVSALSLPDGRFKSDQIKAAMAEVDPDDKSRINILIETLDGHNESLVEFEKEAPKKYEELQSRREAKLREQQEASVKTIHAEFGKITEALPSDVVTLREVPEDVPGGTEWNQAIKTAKENALRILSPGGSDFNESATIAYKGAHYDSVVDWALKDHAELIEARKRLAEYDSGGPDFKGGEKPKTEPKLSASQKYHKTMESLQGGAE